MVFMDLEDARLARSLRRRFICVEGVSQNYGDICPLDEVASRNICDSWCFIILAFHCLY